MILSIINKRIKPNFKKMDLKTLISRTNQLNSKEKIHVLKILKENGIDFTKNENGFFFNLSNLDTKITKQILECIDLIEKNRQCIQDINDKREQLLSQYKSMFEEKLRITHQEKQTEYINNIILKDYSNINIVINRVKKNQKRMFPHLDDPDDIIKAYTQVIKNSLKLGVFKRLNDKMKKTRANLYIQKKSSYMNDEIFDSPVAELEDEVEFDVESIPESIPDIGDDIVEEAEEDILDEIEADLIDIEGDGEDNTSIDSEEYEEENDLDYREKIDQKMQYFKLLLNKKGFQFNESCVLKHDEYIL